ncbi:MAG: glycosyltransferase family 4 protein [Chloroflexi bacterium]|nr:glycosyltransferase family 4 protein [Chloroflexota bacterium]
MRVLFITGEFPPMHGGVGDYTKEIATRLAARGVEVRVLTSQSAGAPTPVVPAPFVVSPAIGKWNWSALTAILKTIGEFAPDVVHIQYQTGAYAMHPAINFLPRRINLSSQARPPKGKRESKIRSVVTFHDLRIPYLFPKAGPVRDWVTRELARSSAVAIATCEQDYGQLQRWGVRGLFLIPIGSNIPAVPPPDYDRIAWRARLGVADDETLLCHFGFVNPDKGVETLVRALHLLSTDEQWRSIRPRLLMIGGRVGASDPANSPYLARIQRLVSELSLQERVLWTDYAPAEIVTANFLASDMCVLPYVEGATLRHGTLMAALAHAMPIITTRPESDQVPSATSLPSTLPRLRDGENCLVVPPNDPSTIAQAVERLVASRDLRTRISKGAGDLAQHFSWDTIVQQQLTVYEHLLRAC